MLLKTADAFPQHLGVSIDERAQSIVQRIAQVGRGPLVRLSLRSDALDVRPGRWALGQVLEVAVGRVDDASEGWRLKGVFQGKEGT